MKLNMKFRMVIWVLGLMTVSLHAGQVNITTTTEHVCKMGESVTFTATANNGNVEVIVISAGGASFSGDTVTFSMPGVYEILIQVNHTGSEEEQCSNDIFTYTYYVPEITGVGDGGDITDDLWFLEDSPGDFLYKVEKNVTILYTPSGKTFTWKIKGQSNVIQFKVNNQQQITNALTSQIIKSIGWSSSEGNLIIEVEYDGNIIAASQEFTTRAPVQISESIDATESFSNGWQRKYTYTVKDKFNKLIPSMSVCEVFENPSSWPKDHASYNWNAPTYGNSTTTISGTFTDNFRKASNSSDIPSAVNPGNPGENTKVMHNIQWYKLGGTGTPGYSATGFEVFRDNLQWCRGTCYR